MAKTTSRAERRDQRRLRALRRRMIETAPRYGWAVEEKLNGEVILRR